MKRVEIHPKNKHLKINSNKAERYIVRRNRISRSKQAVFTPRSCIIVDGWVTLSRPDHGRKHCAGKQYCFRGICGMINPSPRIDRQHFGYSEVFCSDNVFRFASKRCENILWHLWQLRRQIGRLGLFPIIDDKEYVF